MEVKSFFIIAISSVFLLQCNTSKHISLKKDIYEGYLISTVKYFSEVDSIGQPFNEISLPNQYLIPQKKVSYFFQNYLAEYEVHDVYFNGNYTGKQDTSSILFFDLNKKEYYRFTSLNINADLIDGPKNMEDDGYYFFENKYDPFVKYFELDEIMIKKINVNLDTIYLVELDSTKFEMDRNFELGNRFWVNPSIKNFPIQISPKLSKYLNDGFAYRKLFNLKINEVIPDIFIDREYEFVNRPLPDSIKKIMNEWERKIIR